MIQVNSTVDRYRTMWITTTLIAGVFVLLGGICLYQQDAYAATPPDSCFAFTAGTGTITNYYTTEGNVIGAPDCTKNVDVPATIGGQPVLTIASNAFFAKSLTTLTLPNSVTSIGSNAFSNNQLTTIRIPTSVLTIGTSAFANNPLVSAEVPSTVTSVGSNAFFRYAATQMTSPNSLVIQPLSTSVADPSVLFNFNPYTTTIAGVPATIQLSQLAGTPAGVGVGPSYSNIYLPRIDGQWMTGLNTTSIRLATDNTVKAEVTIEPGLLEAFYLYVTDAEGASFRVYGEDESGALIDVTNWTVTSREAYTDVSPANVPNVPTKNAHDIQFARAASQNEDMMLIRVDTASLAQMRRFSVEFTEGPGQPAPANWIQWGYYGVRTPVTPEAVNPEQPSIGAPNTGVGSGISIQLIAFIILTVIGALYVQLLTRKRLR